MDKCRQCREWAEASVVPSPKPSCTSSASFVSRHVVAHTHSLAPAKRGSWLVSSPLADGHPTFLSEGSPCHHAEAALSVAGVPQLSIPLGTPPLHPVAVRRGHPPSRPQTWPDATRMPKHPGDFYAVTEVSRGVQLGAPGPRQLEDAEAR